MGGPDGREGPAIPAGIGGRPALLHAIRHTPGEAERKNAAIREAILAGSPHIRVPNFEEIGVVDLRHLFERYDADFYGGLLSRFLREDRAPISFRLSARMTSAAGKATRSRRRASPSPRAGPTTAYEIAVSTTILFGSFKEPGEPLKVGGLACRDRLEALQRTFEHETLHVAEFLAWGESSCSAPNFRALSLRIFGHEASRHELMTPRAVAAVEHGIRLGDLVSFEHEGTRRTGRVNRITKRATVLVPDPAGRLYSDGEHYLTFYVPVVLLRKESSP